MRPRFRLRSFFILTTALVLAIWILLKPSLDQKLAVAELMQAKARLSYGKTPQWAPPLFVKLLGQDVFVPLKNVRVNGQRLKRPNLEMVPSLPKLVSVTLDNFKVSQAAIDRLSLLKKLAYLHFENSTLDSSLSFQSLHDHPELYCLSFRNCELPPELTNYLRTFKARVIVDEHRLNYSQSDQ